MAANKRKILETARKLAQKGAKDKALREYQKLVRLDPKDAKLRLEIGDAYRRWGQVDEAVDTYSRVAQQYMADGFDARAVAVFKQILTLDPDRFEHYEPLAELYERMGLTAEAIQALQTAADGFHRLGKKREALELLRKMASVDASNTTSRIKVADLLRQEGLKEEAVAEYAAAAAELERQGDVEGVGSVYRRILEIDETHVEALGSLAHNLLARGKAAEAAPLAERALDLDQGNIERYETLVSIYERAGRQADVPGVYRRLANLYRERGDDDRARDILQRHAASPDLSVSTGGDAADELSGAAFGNEALETDDSLFGEEFPETEGSDAALGLDPAPGPGDLGSDARAMSAVELDVRGASVEEPLLDEPAAPPIPTELDVEQLIAEASVYLRYGKRDKAVAHLEAVLASEPEHRGALEKLGEAFADGGESGRAVEAWLRAAKRAGRDGDDEAVAVLRGRIAALDEAAAATLDPAQVAPEAPPLVREAPPLAPEAPPAARGAEIELDLSEVEDESLPDDEEDDLFGDDPSPAPRVQVPAAEAAPDASGPSLVDAGAVSSPQGLSLSSATTQQILEDLEEADFYMQQGLLGEAESIYQRVLSVAPNHPRALVRLGEIAAARSEQAVPSQGPPVQRPPVQKSPEPEEISIDLSDDELSAPDTSVVESAGLEEDLSDLDLDLDDEGAGGDEEEEGSDTAEFTPALEDEESEGTTAGMSLEAEPAGAEGGFDLAAALSDAFDDDPNAATFSGPRSDDDSFSAVFQAFKKGVSETLSEGDFQAHYDLAIAYKEMGLVDDAMAELRLAMGDPARKVECMHLMGVCAIDAGQEPAAVEHLETLLALDGLSDEQMLAGRFDLGRAYQSLGDVAQARRAYQAVAAARPDFQDVQERLASLDAPPAGDAGRGSFESFDDVMVEMGDDDVDDDPDDTTDAAGETFDDLLAEANAGEEANGDTDESSGPAPGSSQPVLTRTPDPPRPKKKKKISFL